MANLPLNSLRALAVVDAAGGVRQAARQLEVSHSAVSRHLRELESWIGVPLIEQRLGERSLRLTVAGQRLAKVAHASLRELQSAVDAIREPVSAFAVTVATTASVAARWLLPRLPDLARAHPRISLSVLVDQRLSDPTESGADLAIRMGEGPWPGAVLEPLMDDQLFPVMGRQAWLDAGKPKTLKQLASLSLLHDRDPSASWERWRRAHGPPDLDLKSGSRFASSDLVLRAASQGLGVALARNRLAAEDLINGHLVRLIPDLQVTLPHAYWLVTPDGTPRPAVRTVIAWLKRMAA